MGRRSSPAAIRSIAHDVGGPGLVQHTYNATSTSGCRPAHTTQRMGHRCEPLDQDGSGRAPTSADDDLVAHNPKVAGSNPAPATNVVPGQRPFPSVGEGLFPLVREHGANKREHAEEPGVVPSRQFGVGRRSAGVSHAGVSRSGLRRKSRSLGDLRVAHPKITRAPHRTREISPERSAPTGSAPAHSLLSRVPTRSRSMLRAAHRSVMTTKIG